MPEAIALGGGDVDLGELADGGSLGADVGQNRMSVEPEFLGALRVRIVDILLEGDAER